MIPQATIKMNIAMPKTMSTGFLDVLLSSSRERKRKVITAKKVTKETKRARERNTFRTSWDLGTL